MASLGSRVAERLHGLGMSQAELGRRLGVSQQAVGKLVHGRARATRHIARLARELGTTPAFLEGETDDPLGYEPDAPLVDSGTREMMARFELMAEGDRRALLAIARSLTRSACADARPVGASHHRLR